MGRIEYFHRLGLGRSAFSPLDRDYEARLSNSAAVESSQQYDDKGRPTSAAAEQLNAALRHAQNEVLELFNVVERAPEDNTRDAGSTALDAARQRRLRVDVDRACSVATLLTTWYPETILQRYLLGLYDPDLPLIETILQDLNAVRTGSLMTVMSTLLPAFPNVLLCSAVGSVTHRAIDALKWKLEQQQGPVAQVLLLLTEIIEKACSLSVLQFLMVQRLLVGRSSDLASDAAHLVGFCSLLRAELLHFDAAALSAIAAFSILLHATMTRMRLVSSTQPIVRYPLHATWLHEAISGTPWQELSGDATQQRDSRRIAQVNARTICYESPFDRSDNAADISRNDHHDAIHNSNVDEHSWTRLQSRHYHLKGQVNALLWGASQLAFRFVVLQCAVGTFHYVVLVPITLLTQSILQHRHPLLGQIGHNGQVSAPTLLSVMNKVGIMLGLKSLVTVATSVAIRSAAHAYTSHR